jgi:hypothetical protein
MVNTFRLNLYSRALAWNTETKICLFIVRFTYQKLQAWSIITKSWNATSDFLEKASNQAPSDSSRNALNFFVIRQRRYFLPLTFPPNTMIRPGSLLGLCTSQHHSQVPFDFVKVVFSLWNFAFGRIWTCGRLFHVKLLMPMRWRCRIVMIAWVGAYGMWKTSTDSVYTGQ